MSFHFKWSNWEKPLWLHLHKHKLLYLDVTIPYVEFEEDLQDIPNAQKPPKLQYINQ